MKLLVIALCFCLLFTGTVSAKAADAVEPGFTRVGTDFSSGIYTLATFTDCSDDSAPVGTLAGMGSLNIDSIPDGAAISLDGERLTYKYCKSGLPPVCFQMLTFTPYVTNIETGTHSITISKPGYKDYTGSVKICPQKVSYVKKTLAIIPTTAMTTPTTAPATTVTTTITTTTTTDSATTVSAAATTAAAGTSAVTAAETPAPTTASTETAAAITATGTGSLSVITTPSGAAVYIDGVQRGVSPATIPGLEAGNHMILLKLAGYQDLSAPVSITAGIQNEYTTGMTPVGAAMTAAPKSTATEGPPPEATKARSPGFEAACVFCALGALLFLRR